MKILLLILVVLLVATIFVFAIRKERQAAAKWPFYAKKIMTSPEQVLFHRLNKALPEHIVLAQVQMSRVLGVKRGANFGFWHNRINRLSLDYVVCRKDAAAIAAIELDDASHDQASRQYADLRKEVALKSAGVPLIRWRVAAMPSEQEIRDTFAPFALGAIGSIVPTRD